MEPAPCATMGPAARIARNPVKKFIFIAHSNSSMLRAPKVHALCTIASKLAAARGALLGFHADSQHLDLEPAGDADDGGDDLGGVTLVEIANQGPVELQLVDQEPDDVAEEGVGCPEVVDRDADPEFLERAEVPNHGR